MELLQTLEEVNGTRFRWFSKKGGWANTCLPNSAKSARRKTSQALDFTAPFSVLVRSLIPYLGTVPQDEVAQDEPQNRLIIAKGGSTVV